MFKCIMSKFKLDIVTFCRTNNDHLYDIIQDHNQYGLREELIGKESFAKNYYIAQIMQVALLFFPLLIAYYFIYVQ